MSDITITISGASLSGKTTLKDFIANKLAEVGINVRLIDPEERGDKSANIEQLAANGVTVNLIEEQLGRAGARGSSVL